jgi:hypothetical protein
MACTQITVRPRPLAGSPGIGYRCRYREAGAPVAAFAAHKCVGKAAGFWSASAHASNPANAWNLSFNNGNDNWNERERAFQVRLVRAGE